MDTYVAQTPTIRTSRIVVGLIVVAFVGALAFGAALASRAISFDSPTAIAAQDAGARVAPGYPAHYGLAGPSSVVIVDAPMGGAPAHGGLAGPAVSRSDAVKGGVPTHGGLAGPSGIVLADTPMGGVPAHGGLAGPSAVVSSH